MLDHLRVEPGSPPRIAERDTGDRLGLDRHDGEARLRVLVERIDELQYRLYAEDRRSVLLVLQGLDASGKDVVLHERTDPSLVAGLVVRVGDVLVDGSLRSRLRTLGTRLAGDRSR